jgi:hypothetical protein
MRDAQGFARVAQFFVSRTEILADTSWLQASVHTGNLSLAGLRGWRLPILDQLRESREASLFPEESCNWSREEVDQDEASYIHYDDGHVGKGPKAYSNGLNAVFVFEE